MCQFMHVFGRDAANDIFLIEDQAFEIVGGGDFVKGQRLFALNAGEIVEVLPDVFC